MHTHRRDATAADPISLLFFFSSFLINNGQREDPDKREWEITFHVPKSESESHKLLRNGDTIAIHHLL